MPRQPRQLRDPGGLTRVEVVEADDGTVRVLVDGQSLTSGPVDRWDLGRVLSAAAEQHGPLRVELTDRAGRVFIDVLHPPAGPTPAVRPAPSAPTPDAPERPSAEHGTFSELVEVTGEGFVPGEEVQVAVVVQGSSVGPCGRARALLDLSDLPDGVRAVVLLGAVSGTLHIEYLP